MGRRGPIARISLQVDPRRGRLCPREAMLDVATHQFRQLEFQSLRADLGAALHRPGANDPDNGPRQHVEPLRRHPGQVGAIDGYFLSAKEVRDHLDRAGQLRRALGYPATENAASPELNLAPYAQILRNCLANEVLEDGSHSDERRRDPRASSFKAT